MTKNLLRKYMDDRLDDEDLKDFEPLHHHVKHVDDDKSRTVKRKKARKSKESRYED